MDETKGTQSRAEVPSAFLSEVEVSFLAAPATKKDLDIFNDVNDNYWAQDAVLASFSDSIYMYFYPLIKYNRNI